MDPSPDRTSGVLPCALAFVASACIMSVEMVAGRLMAIHAGAGLYTWTSVIGVVLAGMTLGNLLGGRIADRFPARLSLSILFFTAMAACLALPFSNYWTGRIIAWEEYSRWDFPTRVAAHVTGVFFIPAAVLGLIGPVVAKLALEGGGATGRTIGNVYAWGALGSILGTFLSGFLLIGVLGTSGVILGVALLLGIQGWLLAPRVSLRLLAVAWPVLIGLLAGSALVTGRGRAKWFWTEKGIRVYEQGNQGPREWLYARESQYSFIRIAEERGPQKTRLLLMDNLLHAIYAPENPKSLLYDYERIYHVLSLRNAKDPDNLSFLFIGGGGYIFPRHVREIWPRCDVQVAEIDPLVTEANFSAFGLRREEVVIREPGEAEAQAAPQPPGAAKPMEIYHLDARNHVDDLLRRKREGRGFKPFDFVYGDAFNDYCVPQHLVTREFMEKVKAILAPGRGVYLMNVIDIYDSGKFLGAMYSTLKAVFPNVYVFTNRPEGPSPDPAARDTWILAASLRDLDLADLGKRPGEEEFVGSVLKPEHLAILVERSNGIILTDDYAPVENLLAEVVRRRALRK